MALNVDKSLRLPPTEFFPGPETKTGICVHHTVGGSADSTFHWWLDDKQMVGTAYLIERDGTIHEVFPPDAWAWQFGLPWPAAKKIKFEKRFVGIELASEGGLIEHEGQLYCFDRVSPKTLKQRSTAFDCGKDFRGYRFFDNYDAAQVAALVQVINHLCERFPIPRRVPSRFFDFYGDELVDFEGIIGHTMVRKDKSDPIPDPALWQRIQRDCGVTAVEVGTPPAPAGTRGLPSEFDVAAAPPGTLSEADLDLLFEANVQELNRMNVAAGSMVKGLILELERSGRNTYIRLHNAVAKGHDVDYEFVQGDRSLVGRIARALGFKAVTDTHLEVRSA
jgi:hypothetical protein